MNSITFDGTVFQPESRVSRAGNPIFTFNLSFYMGKDNDKKNQYGSIQVVAFNGLACNCANVITEKMHVNVEEKLDINKWEKDGEKHSRSRIIANDIGIAVSRFAENGQQPQAGGFGAPAGGGFGNTVPDEEIPF